MDLFLLSNINKPLRSLPLLIGDSRRQIYAGPYRLRPEGYDWYWIKLAKEINAPADFDLPIQDFGTPKDAQRLRMGLAIALDRLALGLPTYVGCMGGQGRTGLFLTLLAKATGVLDPIGYVRKMYNPHAVETRAQERYVGKFNFKPLSHALWRAKGTAALTDFRKATRAHLGLGSSGAEALLV